MPSSKPHRKLALVLGLDPGFSDCQFRKYTAITCNILRMDSYGIQTRKHPNLVCEFIYSSIIIKEGLIKWLLCTWHYKCPCLLYSKYLLWAYTHTHTHTHTRNNSTVNHEILAHQRSYLWFGPQSSSPQPWMWPPQGQAHLKFPKQINFSFKDFQTWSFHIFFSVNLFVIIHPHFLWVLLLLYLFVCFIF